MSTDVKTDVHKDDLRVDLSGRTAIVTGSATGIGSAIATRFAQSGADVVVDYPNEANRAQAQEVFDTIRADGGSVELVRADISQEKDADALVRAAVERFGGLDILVNNAGIEESHPVVEMPLDVWERIIRINLTGSFLCARAAARRMIEQKRGRPYHQYFVGPRGFGDAEKLGLLRLEGRHADAYAYACARACRARHHRQQHRARRHRNADQPRRSNGPATTHGTARGDPAASRR